MTCRNPPHELRESVVTSVVHFGAARATESVGTSGVHFRAAGAVVRQVFSIGISQRNRLVRMQRLAGGSAELGRKPGDSIIIESDQSTVEGGVP